MPMMISATGWKLDFLKRKIKMEMLTNQKFILVAIFREPYINHTA